MPYFAEANTSYSFVLSDLIRYIVIYSKKVFNRGET